MNLSRFFIDRPIFAAVLSAVILLAGVIALTKLPTAEYPEVVPPSVVVRAQYPGANPKVIAEPVAAPLEEPINGVENMLYIESRANSDGNMTTTVTFRLGTDPDKAQQLVQNRVSQAMPRLIFGMLGVTLFGLLLTPVFYVILRKLAGGKPLKDRHGRRPHIHGVDGRHGADDAERASVTADAMVSESANAE